MNKSIIRHTLLAALVIAGVLYFINWNTDSKRVQRAFHSMLKSVDKTEPESLAVAALKANKTFAYFSADATIEPGLSLPRISKPEMKPMLLKGRQEMSTIRLKALGFETSVHSSGNIEMDVTIDVKVNAAGYRDAVLGTYRVEWVKIDGNLMISAIRPLEIVQHPDRLHLP